MEDPSSAAKIGAVSKMGPAAKVGSVSKLGVVSKEGSVEAVLGSIDKLSLVNLISEKSFEVSLVSVFSDTNEESTEASPEVASEELS